MSKSQYPPIGSKWREVDVRVTRTVQVIRYDRANGRVRINCIETQSLTWAKPERFNGKRGGYAKIPGGHLNWSASADVGARSRRCATGEEWVKGYQARNFG